MTAALTPDHVLRLREQFPALSRTWQGRPAIFLDGPAGTQVPRRVIEAISHYLSTHNANHGGQFVTSRESDALLDETHRACAEFFGVADPDCIIFAPNMTTHTFALSRALARRWRPGDEIVVTRLDHDANVTPWVLAARDAGATVHYANIRREDCTLDTDHLRSLLSPRTRLVAVGWASNAVGSVNPVREICSWARAVGAISYVDAVHYAPHALLDAPAIGCDFLVCSAYKFFGPHIGILWGRRELLEDLTAYKVRPAPHELPGKWMTGTQNHECLAGTLAAVEYLTALGRELAGDPALPRRDAFQTAFAAIGVYERQLIERLVTGLDELEHVHVWGIRDPRRFTARLPTVSITHATLTAAELAEQLAAAGIFVWHGNYYALQLTEALNLEPHGMVRLGLVHYNTAEEVARVLEALGQIR